MGKKYRRYINEFFGGRSFDTRLQELHRHESLEHFDPFVSPRKLVPMRDMEDNSTGGTGIVLFAYVNSILHGLGLNTSGAKVKIFEKATNNITGDWAASTNGSTTTANTLGGKCFVPYSTGSKDILFGTGVTSNIWAYDTTADAFTDAAFSTGTFVTSAQGIVTRDDLLLIPYDNKIAMKDAGSTVSDNWSVKLTLPSFYTITDLEEWGDYVAIAVRPSDAGSRLLNSKLFIWDKASEDVSDVIDFGEGELKLVSNIEGTMIGVMLVGAQAANAYAIKPRLQVKAWAGGQSATTMFEIEILDPANDSIAIPGSHCKFKDGNRMVFAMDVKLNNVEETALWCVGRMPGYPFVLEKFIKCNNDTTVTSIEGIYKLGQYWFTSINAAGTITRTNNEASNSFTSTSRWTSQKIDGSGDSPDNAWRKKRLTFVSAVFEPLANKAAVTLEYRLDHNTTWTTIKTFTEAASTANTNRIQAIELAAGTDFPHCREFQLRFSTVGSVSSGGASATLLGVEYEYELIDDDNAAN